MSKAIDKAYLRIRDGIISREFKPGQHLKEEELAVYCEVSRTPIRDALRRLEADEYVVRHDNQRVFVAEWTDDDNTDLFELRAMLEGFAAGRAAGKITPDQIDQMRQHNETIANAVTADGQIDNAVFMENNKAFHRIILEAASSPRLSAMLQRLVEQQVVLRTLEAYAKKDLDRSIGQHEEIIDALAAGDSVWATAAMTSHIRHAQRVFERNKERRKDPLSAAAE